MGGIQSTGSRNEWRASSSSAADQTQSQPAAPYLSFRFYLDGDHPHSYGPASSSSAAGQTLSQPASTPSTPTSLAGFPRSPSHPQGQPPAPSHYLLVPVMMTWEPPQASNSSMPSPGPYPLHRVPLPPASLYQQQQPYHDPEPPPVSSTQPPKHPSDAEPLPLPIAGSRGSSSRPKGQPPAPSKSSMAPPVPYPWHPVLLPAASLYQQRQPYHDPEPPRVSSTQSPRKLKKVLGKYVTFSGKNWECKFCGCSSNSHSNRIIAHLTRTPGKGIKTCPDISPEKIEELKKELKDCNCDRERKKNRKTTSVGCTRDQEEERAYVAPSVEHSIPPPIGNSFHHDIVGMGTGDPSTDFVDSLLNSNHDMVGMGTGDPSTDFVNSLLNLNQSEDMTMDTDHTTIAFIPFCTLDDSDVLKFVVMDFCIRHNIDGNEKISLKDLWTGTISDLRFYAILIAYFLISRKGRCRSVVDVAAEVLELAGNAATDGKKKRIVLLHILSLLLPKKFWC